MVAFLTTEQALDRLTRGDVLRMEIGEDERLWWFEAPLAYVSDKVVRSIINGPAPKVSLVEFGDSLFSLPSNSQTWQAVKGMG